MKGILDSFLRNWRNWKASNFLRGSSVLDLGCGDRTLAKYTNKEYFGLDRLEGYDINENFNSTWNYDNITMIAFIEHIENPVKLLKRLKTCLNPKGRIIITTPAKLGNRIIQIGKYLLLFDKEGSDEHKTAYSEKELRIMVQEAGYKVVHYEKFEFGLNQVMAVEERV